MWLLDRHTDRHRDARTDRRRTKWSLCAAMLHRRHNKIVQLSIQCMLITSYYCITWEIVQILVDSFGNGDRIDFCLAELCPYVTFEAFSFEYHALIAILWPLDSAFAVTLALFFLSKSETMYIPQKGKKGMLFKVQSLVSKWLVELFFYL